LVIAGFIIGEHYHIPPGTVAMLGAAFLLLITGLGLSQKEQAQKVHEAVSEVEWSALRAAERRVGQEGGSRGVPWQ